MIESTVVVRSAAGLHVRPAAEFVKETLATVDRKLESLRRIADGKITLADSLSGIWHDSCAILTEGGYSDARLLKKTGQELMRASRS